MSFWVRLWWFVCREGYSYHKWTAPQSTGRPPCQSCQLHHRLWCHHTWPHSNLHLLISGINRKECMHLMHIHEVKHINMQGGERNSLERQWVETDKRCRSCAVACQRSSQSWICRQRAACRAEQRWRWRGKATAANWRWTAWSWGGTPPDSGEMTSIWGKDRMKQCVLWGRRMLSKAGQRITWLLWKPWEDVHNATLTHPVEAWRRCMWRWLRLYYRWRQSSQIGWRGKQSSPGSLDCTSWGTSPGWIILWRTSWQFLQEEPRRSAHYIIGKKVWDKKVMGWDDCLQHTSTSRKACHWFE